LEGIVFWGEGDVLEEVDGIVVEELCLPDFDSLDLKRMNIRKLLPKISINFEEPKPSWEESHM
jgi:hypothetical protein